MDRDMKGALNMRQLKKMLLVFPVLSIIYLINPVQANAWFFDWGSEDHHGRDHDRYRGHDRDREYSEVVVGGDRYYYNEGVFYRGAPGSYVVVGAPVGAVVYSAPADLERVDIDGDAYFRSHDVYYRHTGRGYQVVERPHRHEDGHGRRDEERHDHR